MADADHPPAAEVAKAYLASFASGDPDRIAALVSEDFQNNHASALGSPCEGRDEYRRRLPGFLASLPGLAYEVTGTVEQDARVAVTYQLSATSDGKPVAIDGVMMIEVREGVITSRTDYWDSLTFLRQIGQADEPDEAH